MLEVGGTTYDYYTISQFIEVKHGMEKLIEGIPITSKDNVAGQLSATLTLLSRVASIAYDSYVTSDKGKKDNRAMKNSRSLYNGLVHGKAVCTGKALIFREAALERGIDAKVIGGYYRSKKQNKKIKKYLKVKNIDEYTAPEQIANGDSIKSIFKFIQKKRRKYYSINSGGHTWCQVCIGGYWLNCDPTNLDSVFNALLNDIDFNADPKVCYYRRESSISDIPEKCELALPEILDKYGI